MKSLKLVIASLLYCINPKRFDKLFRRRLEVKSGRFWYTRNKLYQHKYLKREACH